MDETCRGDGASDCQTLRGSSDGSKKMITRTPLLVVQTVRYCL